MTDDEHTDPSDLGRFLRDEVPAPGPGYWDAIDERLAAIGSNTAGAETDADTDAGLGSVPDAGAPGSIDPDVDESPETTDTGAEVIRLTDMTTRPAHRFRSAPMLVGAAAALVVLLGLGVALTRGDNAQEVATDDGNPDTETTELDADPTDDSDGDPTEDGTDGDAGDPDDGDASTDSDGSDPAPGDPAAIRFCYAGGELAEGVTSYVDLSGPIDSEPTVRIASRSVLGDNTFYEVIEGTVASDGAVTGQFTDLASGTRFDVMFVFVSEDGLSLADDVFVEPVDCEAIADDISDIETAVNSVDLDEIAIPQPQTEPEIDFLPGEFPRLWNHIGQDASVLIPGGDQSVESFGQEQILVDTGRRAQANDMVWVEIAAGEERPRSWVLESELVEYIEPAVVEAVEFLEDDEEPRIWTIASDETVSGLSQPGLDAEVVATFEPGEQFLVGTARRATADGQLWIQLAARPLPGAARSWVPRDAVELIGPDLTCYASQDWESEVLVIQFDQDAESFTGTLILRTSDVVTAEYFAANGVLNIDQGSSFTVNVQEFGSPDIVTEEWRGVRDGFSLANRAFPNVVPCAFVVDSVQELAFYGSDLIPPAPEPAG